VPDENSGYIRISNREIYDAVVALDKRLANLENIVGNVLNENSDLRKRTRGLELRFYGILAGLLGAITVLLAAPGGL
jgi:hypothetical protein